ncbi:hypothetical protein ACEK06_00765 [Pseudomonas brenneri]|uniref:hypothetical protein n=1 Tax=Pseudomonas brenneri TaxID=129817 RepID=UPI003570B827
MFKPLILGLALLGGCTHVPQPVDISGVWINQAAIDAAAQGRPLLKTLSANGRNLEWDIDTRTARAHASSAFEADEGQLLPKAPGVWTIGHNGYGNDELQLKGQQLLQLPRKDLPGQVFQRPHPPAAEGVQWGNTFRQALNSAYMGGLWKILEGQGAGGTVVFNAAGNLSGLGKNDRYELCLGGDCATQGAGNDTLYLGKGDVGDSWIFVRYGNTLEIFQAVNHSRPDEVPQLSPGPRQWLLEKQ